MVLSVSGGESFSLSAAQRNERNILARLQRSHATEQLYRDLWHDRKTIEAVTAYHLGQIDPSACTVQEMDTWLTGQFNICIIIHIHNGVGKTSRKIFRCPIPHKVGEQYSPGAVDEKIRAEVATYAWIETNCPNIPIPYLHAFGLSSSLQFTHHTYSTGYVRDTLNIRFDRPYLLLDYIDSKKGRMLSDTLKEFRATDQNRMQNLCRGISRVMLSLASKAQSRIGSLRFNDDGSTTITNRPLFCTNSILESEGAPKTVNRTYTTSGTFIDDMLRFREEAFRAQPNAVNDEEDCHLQMLHMILLRFWKSQFADYHFEGPFVLQLTDFHASNIFVDDEWNIVALIDLEYICALPPSMMNVPHWLSVDAIDEISDHADAFDKMHEAFVDKLRDEERSFSHEHEFRLASAIQESWTNHSCWFYRCLTSINGMAYCLEDHLYEKFHFKPSPNEERRCAKIMSSFWSSDSKKFVEQKLRDKANYDEDMAHHFNGQEDAGSNDTHASRFAARITCNNTL